MPALEAWLDIQLNSLQRSLTKKSSSFKPEQPIMTWISTIKKNSRKRDRLIVKKAPITEEFSSIKPKYFMN